jgi:acetyl-CoA C-acetyltransferase
MTEVIIAGAARTPIGSFNGAFADVPAHRLGTAAISAALTRAGIEPAEVDQAVFGQVLVGGQGQNPVRQAAIAAGMTQESTAFGISQVCGSGLSAVILAALLIRAGEAGIVVAGGQESMSLAPHLAHLRAGAKMGPVELTDSMIRDGLWDVFNDYHMGVTAENLAERFQVGRAEQDAFALASQSKAAAARACGRFAGEIAPVTVKKRKGDVVVDQDEYPRPETTLETLSGLRPAFAKNGTVTAGNASGINDGAAALVLMGADEAATRGIKPLARVVSSAMAGVDPAIMGTGPIPATRKALDKAGWSVSDLDLVEANEAFAAQAVVVNRELGFDPAKVNVNGGAIALGHPIGASGARILVTLLHEMHKRDVRRGLATLCVGGGMGIALCVERG